MNRKFKKLLRDPKLFFADMYKKRKIALKKYSPIKYQGTQQYSVVSAVYNVGKYLDDYFISLTKQSLDFKKHIHLILVDDGSTDNSATIIKKWQKKYPKNIHYIYKENGGIASARNLGMQHVKTKWVTFIDSDDFVHPDYFKIVDDAISKNDSIKLAVGNLKFYFEENKLVQDTHSLRYRFSKEINLVPIQNLDKNINLFVTVSFFQTEILRNANIEFDSKIKPNFEDGKYLADYFLHAEDGNVAYLQKAIFFYRKRGDGSSTIDGSWQKKEKFYNLFVYGYIPMLKAYKEKYGKIPKNIQWTVLYEICWHVKTLINCDYKIDMLSSEDAEIYYQLVRETLSYIDEQHIIDFDLIGIWFFYKVGLLGLINKKPPFNIAYIENVDREKKQILVVYQYTQDHSVSFRLDNSDIIPRYKKITDYLFARKPFVHEVRAWIPFESLNSQFTVTIDGKNARISVFGKQHNGWKIQDILDKYKPSKKYQVDGSWIIMDRDTQADDNGEHFYRFMKNHHPEQECYFALNKNSHDWPRLEKEGFNLLDFGSRKYEAKLRKASKIISGHFDEYVQNYFGDEYEHSKKFIFLQHGVIQNNLSRWLNYKRNLALFITSTPDEYASIALDGTPYHVGQKEVVLTGLARHDKLLAGNQTKNKIILIMPTWRANSIGKSTKTGNAREFNENFMNTNYAKHWNNLLHSEYLKNITDKYGYKIIFAPHANIEPYLSLFRLPPYIKTWSAANSSNSMQELFQTASLMITDYSSVAFEMGFLKKPVLYYQFDRDEVFSGGHIIQEGYFKYEKHGFGPVVTDEQSLLSELERILKNNGESYEPYLTRSKNTFPYRDGKNCERIYQAIQDMDKLNNSIQTNILEEFTEQAYRNNSWHLLEERSYQLNKLSPSDKYQQYYYLSLFKQNKFVYLSQCLSKNKANTQYWEAKIGLHLNDIENALKYFQGNPSEYLDDRLLCLIYAAASGNHTMHKNMYNLLESQVDKPIVKNMLELSTLLMQNRISSFLNKLDHLCESWTIEIKRDYKLELLAVNLLSAQKEFSKANSYLSRYWKHTKHDPAYFLAAANMSFQNGNHERAVSEISQGFKEHFMILSSQELKKYAISFRVLANKLENMK